MHSAKDSFLSNQNLSEWWSKIVSNPNYDQVMLHAAAVVLEGMPSLDQRVGVMAFREILTTLSEKDSTPVHFSKPGLDHDLDSPKLERKTKSKKE